MSGNYYYILILLLISLFLNLGIYPLFLEEPRRAVVALEMTLTGNYIVPTIMGELYFAKPPLFNWILILASKVFGSFSEFSVRFPTVISLILIGVFNYLFVRKYLNSKVAFFSSLIFITSGTIFFYFSILGEIDIFYSLITYLSIISVIFFFTKDDLPKLYIFSFLFGSFGFLTKGFPSVVFLYGTVILVLLSGRKYKYLFSKYHLLGILIFTAIIGTYFYLYNLYHPIIDYLQFLWSESSGRTVIGENKSLKLLMHLFTFPLKTLIALIPWSILIIFIFRKNFFTEIFSNDILKIALIVFLGNYFVYWISPGANQRYVYMLYPFLILIFTYFYFKYKDYDTVKSKIFNIFTILFILILDLVSIGLPFLVKVPLVIIIPIGFGIIFTLLIFSAYKSKSKILYLLLSLVIFRILFDVVYLPIKSENGDSYWEKFYGIQVCKIANEYNPKGNLFYYGKDKLPHGLLFYIERERKKIIKRNLNLNKQDMFLSKTEFIKNLNIRELYRFKIKGNEYILFKVM